MSSGCGRVFGPPRNGSPRFRPRPRHPATARCREQPAPRRKPGSAAGRPFRRWLSGYGLSQEERARERLQARVPFVQDAHGGSFEEVGACGRHVDAGSVLAVVGPIRDAGGEFGREVLGARAVRDNAELVAGTGRVGGGASQVRQRGPSTGADQSRGTVPRHAVADAGPAHPRSAGRRLRRPARPTRGGARRAVPSCRSARRSTAASADPVGAGATAAAFERLRVVLPTAPASPVLPAKRLARGLGLVATDLAGSAGDGPRSPVRPKRW